MQSVNEITFASLMLGGMVTALMILICMVVNVPFGIRLAALTSFFAHGFLGVTNVLWEWFPINDQETYHQQGLALADGRRPQLWQESKQAWPVILSWMYRFIEPNLLLGIILNALFTGATVLLVYQASAALSRRAGGYAVGLLLIMPSSWIWGSFALREALVWLICSGIAVCLVKMKDGSVVGAIGFFVLCGLLVPVRGPLVLLILAGMVPALILGSTSKLRGTLLSVGVVGGALYAFNAILAETLSRSEDLDLIRNDQARASSGFATENVVATLIRVLGGPFPWEVPSLGLIYAPFGLYAMLVVAASIGGAMTLGKSSLWLLGPAGSVVLGLALASGNYGTMIRLRDMATILVLPLAAEGVRRVAQAPFWSLHRPATLPDGMLPAPQPTQS